MFSVSNACKTDFLIGVFREQFDSSFKQEKALCSQDDAVFNQDQDVCTVVIQFDSIPRSMKTATTLLFDSTFDQDNAVFNQDQDVCTVVIRLDSAFNEDGNDAVVRFHV